MEINNDIIVEESLYELGFKKEDKLLFSRSYNSQTQKIVVEIGGNNAQSARTKLLEKLLAENILENRKLLLSYHSMLNSTKITIAFNWFVDGLQVLFPNTKFAGMAIALSDSARFSTFANSMITTFDTGVTHIDIDIISMDEFFGEDNYQNKRKLMDHLIQTKQDTPIPLKNGSIGACRRSQLLSPRLHPVSSRH